MRVANMSKVLMPQMGESIAEGTIVRWMKRVGDVVDKDEPLFEISTDKVDAEIPSPDAGVLIDIRVLEGETVPVHTVVGIIGAAGDDVSIRSTAGARLDVTPARGLALGAAAETAPASPASGPLPDSGPGENRRAEDRSVFVSPVVRRMAAAHNLDVRGITGTGSAGRVTKKDVDAFLAGPSPAPAGPRRVPLYQPGDDVRVEKMTVMRRRIADRMLASIRTSAHIYSAYEVDFSRIAMLRAKHKGAYEQAGSSLTYTAFVTHAVAATIREFPYMNASVDGEEIVFRNEINIGMAVALEHGLIVPVIRKANEMHLRELCVAISDLAQRARTKQLKVEEVESGTFTITNPGIFGGLWGLPIINQPQVAILAVGSIDKRAVVVDDQIVARPMAYLTLGYDHRLIDGADGGRFLLALKDRLQNFDEALL
jgi:2-oxoglutarate dehydrogenase E2 component (dihydrolipoamide succinyltransferase)